MKEQKVPTGKDPKAMKDMKEKDKEKEKKGAPAVTKPAPAGPAKR